MADINGAGNGKDACRLDFVLGASASMLLNSTRNKYTVNGFAGLRLISDGHNLDLMQLFIEKDLKDRNITGGINILNMKLKHSITNSTITNNGGPGIELDGNSDVRVDNNTISGNTVGILINDVATGSISNNTITANGKGIAIAGVGTGIGINRNLIFNNTGLGIDLGNDGVTPNHVGGPIPGPNNYQNYPILTNTSLSGSDMIIKGTLNSASNGLYRVEFFSNTTCNPTGFGDGQTYLGFKQVTTDLTGNANFSDTVTGVSIPMGTPITSTATDSANNTSEFSACLMAGEQPLYLISFTAMPNGGHITLNWTTALEQNLKYFDIERSQDGMTFNKIGQQQASDSSSLQKNYTYIDQQPLQGTNFYRIRMVGLDSAFAYSNIITAKLDTYRGGLAIFPDPASNEINVQLSATGMFSLKLVDVNGRIVRTGNLQLSGNTSTVLNIRDLPRGLYILILQNSKEKQYKKFVKQ